MTELRAEMMMLLVRSLRPPRNLSRLSLAAAALTSCVASVSVTHARGSFFENVAGTWAGTGTVTVSGAKPERLRCQAEYAAAGPTRLHIGLRCASDSFNLEVSSDVARQGDRIGGNWNESTTGASGDISGTVGASQLQAAISGPGVSGRLTVTLRGDGQSVALSSEGAVSATAAVTLARR